MDSLILGSASSGLCIGSYQPLEVSRVVFFSCNFIHQTNEGFHYDTIVLSRHLLFVHPYLMHYFFFKYSSWGSPVGDRLHGDSPSCKIGNISKPHCTLPQLLNYLSDFKSYFDMDIQTDILNYVNVSK